MLSLIGRLQLAILMALSFGLAVPAVTAVADDLTQAEKDAAALAPLDSTEARRAVKAYFKETRDVTVRVNTQGSEEGYWIVNVVTLQGTNYGRYRIHSETGLIDRYPQRG